MGSTVAPESEQTFTVGPASLQVRTGGSGRPLLLLHDEMGYPGWCGWQSDLAATRQFIIPLAPGFGIAPRLEWLRDVRDLASVYVQHLRRQQLTAIDVIGFSLGGWIAAEMLLADPALFRRAVLVAPLGIKPPKGVILDAFTLTQRAQLEATVRDPASTPEFNQLYGGAASVEQLEAFEDARAESARLAWQPYMHNPALPSLLRALYPVPSTLVIHGADDQVVPRSAAEAYVNVLTDAQLLTLSACGHRPEIEQRGEFVAAIRKFLD